MDAEAAPSLPGSSPQGGAVAQKLGELSARQSMLTIGIFFCGTLDVM